MSLRAQSSARYCDLPLFTRGFLVSVASRISQKVQGAEKLQMEHEEPFLAAGCKQRAKCAAWRRWCSVLSDQSCRVAPKSGACVKPQELSAGELLNNTSQANYGGKHLLLVSRLKPHRWRRSCCVCTGKTNSGEQSHLREESLIPVNHFVFVIFPFNL